MKYFGIFSDSGEVQTALVEESLVKPYVAIVSGALDYNTVAGVPMCYVEDSYGNIYEGVDDGNGTYSFDFMKPTDATWTLYYSGSVVTTWGIAINKVWSDCENTCNDVYDNIEVHEEDYPVEDITMGTGDYPDGCGDYDGSEVNVVFSYDSENNAIWDGIFITLFASGLDCNCYEDFTQEKCECEGKYWYNDECHDEPEQSDPCAGDPECECYQDGYSWWEHDTCHNCNDEWEELGYSSPEECACDRRGPDSGVCPEE